MKIFNSLTRKTESFKPLSKNKVGLYSCGMTVYDYAHIGHGRKYVTDDLLRRVLEMNGYDVHFVQNVTDVGHLTSDADEGEDKLEKGAAKANKTVWEVARVYEKHFYDSMKSLNVLKPDIITRATEHINQQIALVEKLIKNGHAYETPEAVYFDIESFPKYGAIFGQRLEEKQVAVRERVKKGDYKKNPQDFALWFKRVGRFENHTMHWKSPWGDGFPGWHIECSAMSMQYLGDQFDIHTGGEDHVSIHHPNEIAQSEAATGKSPFVKYWIHTAFLTVDGTKMSKSLNNFFTIEDIEKKGFDPLALRYFYMTAHYRKNLNFTWESLKSAQNAYNRLVDVVLELKSNHNRTDLSEEKLEKVNQYRRNFEASVNNDLNMPQALASVWEVVKSNIPSNDKLDLLYSFDEVLGLGLREVKPKEIDIELKEMIKVREKLRLEKKYAEADELREKLEKMGMKIKDE